MMKVAKDEFEKIVGEGIEAIPEKFLSKLDNVSIVIEDEPTTEQRKKMNIGENWTLLGLYEGVSQLNRGSNYTFVLPDKITIFQKAIEEEAESIEDMREIVKNTVWHEIAHHFGMDENEVRRAEERRKKGPPINPFKIKE